MEMGGLSDDLPVVLVPVKTISGLTWLCITCDNRGSEYNTMKCRTVNQGPSASHLRPASLFRGLFHNIDPVTVYNPLFTILFWHCYV